MTSRSAQFAQRKRKHEKIEFQCLTKSKFNDIKDKYFGNVPLEKAFDLFKEECDLNGIDLLEIAHSPNRRYD